LKHKHNFPLALLNIQGNTCSELGLNVAHLKMRQGDMQRRSKLEIKQRCVYTHVGHSIA